MIFFIDLSVPIWDVIKDYLFLLELLWECFFVIDFSILKSYLVIVKKVIVLNFVFSKIFIIKLISDFDSLILKFNNLLN